MTQPEVYQIVHAPRLPREGSDKLLGELLLSQRVLWQALYFSHAGATVSVVWVCLKRGARIDVYLVVENQSPDSGLRIPDVLPIEYGWKSVSAQTLSGEIGAVGLCSSTKLRRRLQFVNLPNSRGLRPGGLSGTSSAQGRSAPQLNSTTSSGGSRRLPVKRNLPMMRFHDSMGTLIGEWCIPVLGEVVNVFPNRRRLCEDLQRNAPAMVSMHCHPVPIEQIDHDKECAMTYCRSLEDLGAGLANAGFARVEDIYRTYTRYLLGKAGLCHLTLGVTADSRERSEALAHSLAARSGGMKSFEVQTSGFKGVFVGSDSIDGGPRVRHGGAEILEKEDELRSLLKAERIEAPDPADCEFLRRFPHLYTIDEMEGLFRLPFGNEDGLPGIETRPLPPFYSSAVQAHLVRDGKGFAHPRCDSLRIGRVSISPLGADPQQTDALSSWHMIPKEDLCKHALIVGSTGSGKTLTTSFLLRECERLGVPFLVVEPVKTEYYDKLAKVIPVKGTSTPKGLRRWNFENDRGREAQDFLAFDPMRLQPGVSVARHASYLKSCFEAAFPMEAWMALLLENGILEYYTGERESGCCGLHLFSRGMDSIEHPVDTYRVGPKKGNKDAVYPSFDTFVEFFVGPFIEREYTSGMRVESDDAWEKKQLFRRRFKNLSQGPLGRAFALADEDARRAAKDGNRQLDPVEGYRLFGVNTIIELDAISDSEQKALVMAFLMTFLFEKRQAEDIAQRRPERQGEEPSIPKHVLVIEEAHRLLSNASSGRGDKVVGQDAKSKAVSLFVDMLAEIRAWGQGIVIVEQIPTKVVSEAVKNTNLKIMLRTTSREDRDFLGAAMNFNEAQNDFVTSLRADKTCGIQYVVFEEGVDQPLLLTLPLDYIAGEKNLFDRYFT